MKPKENKSSNSDTEEPNTSPSLLLIIKWGGELTTAGVLQAEALGKLFRTLYPGIQRTDGKDGPEDTQGLGFLRLHSTYRHDLKIYSSDEGRVQMTAASFAKGLLALEGELTPILMQMVKSANTDGLLNDDYNARQFQNELKSYLHSILQASSGEFERFYLCVKNMADIVVPQEYGISEESKIRIAQRVCTPLMAKMKNDLHRCVQSPEEDNESLTRLDPRASEGIATPMRHVRTRLYFTSESHIHTLMNLIRYGGLCSPDDKKWQRAMNFLSGVTEFNYMSQVVFMVYEDSRNESEKEGKDRFHIELLFSPGLYPCFQTEKERIYESRFNSTKQKMQNPLNSKSKKHKHNGSSGGASAEASDKETADVEATKKDSTSARKDSIVENFTSQRSKSTDSSMIEKSRKIKAKMLLEVSNSPEQGGPLTGESDDDLGSDHAVNLVVLGEITGKQFTADELAMHSPPNLHNRKRHPTGGTKIINNTGSPDEPDNDNQTKFYIPNPIVKSMSESTCNLSINIGKPVGLSLYHHLISPELEENQATVGSGRGKWANELVAETRAAMAKEAVESGNVVSPYASSSGISTKNEDYEDRRPTASAVFTRGDVIVMKRSESSDPNPLSEMPGNASTATIGTTNDEQNYNNVRRSRFPYRFKHHTVNLLTDDSKKDTNETIE
uniref:Inositol hexakisphosphate and diphosphoinositol-pentakisphosphate kinase n=1 Tax=Acrobeloides nanus TaxID=290746 RepID=A0A914ER27_9BILA